MPGIAERRPGVGLAAAWETPADDHVIALEWLATCEACAAGTSSGTLLILERATGAIRVRTTAHRRGLTSLSSDPRGGRVATCGQDGMVRIWDTRNGEQLQELSANADWAGRVAWSPDGALLACAAGRAVRIWNREGRLVREFPTHRARVTDLRWQPSESVLCSTGYGGVTLLDPRQEKPLHESAWQGSSLVARWSTSGRYIATGDQDCTVHFWIVRTGQDLQVSGDARTVRELAWDAKGRLLATGGGNEVTVWDCSGRGPAGSKPIRLPGHEREVTAIEFQRHGEWLASGGADGRVVLWSPIGARKLVGATLLSQPVSQLAWSPDGRDLAIGGAAGMVTCIPTSGSFQP